MGVLLSSPTTRPIFFASRVENSESFSWHRCFIWRSDFFLMLSNVFPQINPLSSVPQALHNSASFGACNVTITLQGSFASRSSGCKVMGGWLVDFQECLLSGRGWRRKEPKRNACKFNDIAGTSEAFQHTDTHRQRSRNCSGEIRPCQFL